MISIKRHLSRTNRRLWDLCPDPPRYLGRLDIEEYGGLHCFHTWAGRHPRTLEWILFAVRKIPRFGGWKYRTMVFSGLSTRDFQRLTSHRTADIVVKVNDP